MSLFFQLEDGKQIELPIQAKALSFSERIRSAAKIFLICIGGAIFSIFIPVLHFIFVPGFIIAAIVGLVLKLKVEKVVDLSQQNCPTCLARLEEGTVFFKSNQPSIKIYCGNCRKSLKLIDTQNLHCASI